MSEDISLTSADGVPPNIQRTLSKLEAEPLAVNRDQLFFQAGYAAGSRRRSPQYLWPSAVAALLLMCVGLAAALVHQGNRPVTMDKQQAVALGSSDQQPAQKSPPPAERTIAGDMQSRFWRRLASTAPLPPGQLTAMGLTETPARMDGGEWAAGDDGRHGESHDREPVRRPSTYLELRLQEEG